MSLKLRNYDDLSELEKMSLINMSYSRLNSFGMCEAMYFYKYITKVPDEFGAAAVNGNVIHSVLEKHVGEELVYEDLMQSYYHYLQEYDPESKIGKDLIDASHQMIAEFVDRHKGETFNVVGKELEFKIVIGSALFRGYIDLLTKTKTGRFSVCDFKSGKFEVTQKDVPNDLQLGLYALVVAQKYNIVNQPVYAELYYLRTGRRKGHLFSPTDLQRVYEELLSKVQEIINKKNFTPVSGNGRLPCWFCQYATPEVCRIGAINKEKALKRGY